VRSYRHLEINQHNIKGTPRNFKGLLQSSKGNGAVRGSFAGMASRRGTAHGHFQDTQAIVDNQDPQVARAGGRLGCGYA
jgi:hypothetical protein